MTTTPIAGLAPRILQRMVAAAAIALALSACASQKAATPTEAYDPIEPVNRAIYRVNDPGTGTSCARWPQATSGHCPSNCGPACATCSATCSIR